MEKKQELFQNELNDLMKKYSVNIYSANVVMPNGEVLPMIKIRETGAGEEVKADEDKTITKEVNKKDEDTTKK